MNATTQNDLEIVSSRLFPVSPERLFEAWTDPEQLARWWGPQGFRNTFYEFDLKPGGFWRFTMHGPRGHDYPNESVFVEITNPSRIILDHLSDPEFRIVATFEEKGGHTLLIFRMIFPSADLCAQVKTYAVGCNEENFDRLEQVLGF